MNGRAVPLLRNLDCLGAVGIVDTVYTVDPAVKICLYCITLWPRCKDYRDPAVRIYGCLNGGEYFLVTSRRRHRVLQKGTYHGSLSCWFDYFYHFYHFFHYYHRAVRPREPCSTVDILWITLPLRGLTLGLWVVLSYTLYRGESQSTLYIKWLTTCHYVLYCIYTIRKGQGIWYQGYQHYQGYQEASLYQRCQYCQYQCFKAVHHYQRAVKTASLTVSWRGYQRRREGHHGIRRWGLAMGLEFPICRGTGTGCVRNGRARIRSVDNLWITCG